LVPLAPAPRLDFFGLFFIRSHATASAFALALPARGSEIFSGVSGLRKVRLFALRARAYCCQNPYFSCLAPRARARTAPKTPDAAVEISLLGGLKKLAPRALARVRAYW
jgi:hypothetical protein